MKVSESSLRMVKLYYLRRRQIDTRIVDFFGGAASMGSTDKVTRECV